MINLDGIYFFAGLFVDYWAIEIQSIVIDNVKVIR